MTYKILAASVIGAVLVLMVASPNLVFADREGTTKQKFNTGTMFAVVNFGQSGSVSLSGHVTTKPDGTENLSQLNGTITSNGQTITIHIEPIGAININALSGFCIGTSAEQIGTVKTIGNGPAVKGIINLMWTTTQNCGGSEHAVIWTESNTGVLTVIQASGSQSPIG